MKCWNWALQLGLLLLLTPWALHAQENREVHGFVYWDNPDPLAESRHFAVGGAVVLWAQNGAGTTTDADGHFELPLPPRFPARLIIRAAGFQDREYTFTDATHTTIQVWKHGEQGAQGSLSPNHSSHPETGQHGDHFHGVEGEVLAVEDSTMLSNPEPLAGASVRWLGERQGRLTDENGHFKLPDPLGGYPARIVVFFPNYFPDTVTVNRAGQVRIVLFNRSLPEVVIATRRRSTEILTTETMRTEVITSRELTHAACCNLSEAFETNTHVDVNYTDAVTGAKEIQMLGLAGTYVQLMHGHSPGVRGLGRALGLQFVPGPWVQDIRLVKGIGSVLHGYESITGQLAYQYLCPVDGPRVLLNAYGNTQTRWEGNAWLRQRVGKWRTGTALHASGIPNSMDNNGDGFIDQPTYRQLNAFQIWKQPRTDGTLTEVSAQVVDENRNGGQMEMPADPNAHHALPRYTLGLHTQRAEASFRTGHRLNEDKEWQTVAVFASGAFHRLTGNFGARAYEGEQRFGWVRAMYKTIVGNTLHVLTMGPSFMYDEYSERFDSLQLNRSELVPGAYAEYNGQLSDKLSIVAGLRADVHNLFGLLVTPRVHLKYDIAQRLNLRVGGGRGLHTPNVLVENLNVLTSSRRILMRSPLKPEDAWNVGVSAVWHVRLGKMPAYWAADYYRTQFARQQVVDLDAMPGFAFVYNHEGTSFSNAAQTEVYVEPLEWLNFKAAYKFYDVRARYAGRLQQRPLVPKHRVMLTATLDRPRWMLNATALWVGPQRLPSTSQLPTEHQRPDWSPSYVRIIAQATYRLGDRKQWEVYIGGENLTNYVVRNALIAPEDPFGPYFDTSMAWGPVMGAMGYAGFRWKLE